MSDNYDATLLEQLEDTEGENEILSLEVERLTNLVDTIQAEAERKQEEAMQQLFALFPKPADLSSNGYAAYIAQKIRSLQNDTNRLRQDAAGGYIDVMISKHATQMYKGDQDGMPDPTDRMSYDAWMRNGMKYRQQEPMKNVYRITRDDLVKEFFKISELLVRVMKQSGYNNHTYSNDGDEMLWNMADQSGLSLFRAWLGVQQGRDARPARSMSSLADRNSIYLQCTPAGRDDCEKVLTVLKRHSKKNAATDSMKININKNKRVYIDDLFFSTPSAAKDYAELKELYMRVNQNQKRLKYLADYGNEE